MRSLFVLLVSVLLSVPALAAPPKQPPPKQQPSASPPREQRLTFEDDLITAGRDLGGGDILAVQRPAKHSNLVRARADFIPELIKSAEDI